MDTGLSCKKFSVSGPPALLCLSESLLETLPLLLSPTTACDERSHPLDLAPGVLIFFSSHRFPILCHFFFKSAPSPTSPRLSSFFLFTKSFSSLMPHKHANRISISPAERREGKKKKEKKQEGKRTGQKSHFQSE